MRKKIVAGNWKMNKTHDDGIRLIKKCIEKINISDPLKQVIFAPPFYLLKEAVDLSVNSPSVFIAAQNCHDKDSGAYTGEISASMLKSVGVDYVILGHSERRKYFGDNDGWIARKIDSALEAGLKPIFCCGEELGARQAGQQKQIVKSQLRGALYHLNGEKLSEIVIAYEPVWAIGTGETASPEQAQEMHAFIRDWVADKFTNELAQMTTILYGGSCNPDNAQQLFSQQDVDGGLIGGASLDADKFVSIINHL